MDRQVLQNIMDKYQEEWCERLPKLGKEMRELIDTLDGFTGKYGANYDIIPKLLEEFKASGLKPSEFFKKHYGVLVECFVPEEYIEDYYTIIDKLNQFPYSKGTYRRTVRCEDYAAQFEDMVHLLNSYKSLAMYKPSFYAFVSGCMSEEYLELRKSYIKGYKVESLDLIIAARIDAGDSELISVINEMILGENNTSLITTEVIRGIVMSSNAKLHKLLCDFLLAARLQEGVRQAVCENADCGTIEAFVQIFNTVYDNDLIRYASIKRALATWTGMFDFENAERISKKLLESLHEALNDSAKALEFTKTNDSMLIVCGLWCLGFYDVNDAISVMKRYIEEGTRNQLLTMGYYNSMLYYNEFANKVSAKIIKKYPEDYEIIAVFMASFMRNIGTLAYRAIDRNYNRNNDGKPQYKKISLETLGISREDAYEYYDIFKSICKAVPKKKFEFSPIIFPWYSAYLSKTQMITRMCVIAYALEDDNLKDDACAYITEIDVNEDYTNRSVYMELLTGCVNTAVQRKTIINSLTDKEAFTRQAAFRMVKNLVLTDAEYKVLEGFLKYKTADLRKQVLELLNMQTCEKRIESALRLVLAGKPELRMGGLSILQDIKQNEKNLSQAESSAFDKAVETLNTLEKVSDNEQVIIEELCGNGKASEILDDEGYGLYRPSQMFENPKRETNPEVFKKYFEVSKKSLDDIIDKLEAFINEHGNLEYKTVSGETQLLANGMYITQYSNGKNLLEDCYPFKELWAEFYEENINDPKLLQLLDIAVDGVYGEKLEKREVYDKNTEKLLGPVLSSYHSDKADRHGRRTSVDIVISILASMYTDKGIRETVKEMLNYIIYNFTEDDVWYKIIRDNNYFHTNESDASILDGLKMGNLYKRFAWKNDEEFKEYFSVFYDIDRLFKSNDHIKTQSYYGVNNHNYLKVLDYIKAFTLDLIPENEIYKAVFEYGGVSDAIRELSIITADKILPYNKNSVKNFLEDGEVNKESAFYKKAEEVYTRILDKVLDVELARGDLPTTFSSGITNISKFYGMDRMVQILTALGKEKLDRSTYYYSSSGDSKKVVLSHLLSVCYPKPEDNAEGLAKLLKGKKLTKARLYETMMYAPQWIDIIEVYLGQELKSGCYYFMAHMNERFDDKKKAVIAKYTPLSDEELNNGAFDLQWFNSAYNELGEETFNLLYDAAKYISDGSKHSRARKYADAALGKVAIAELEKDINDKRNKDLLMSYGIVPIVDEDDSLHRYEYIERFRKESKQFGAQRQASEKTSCDMALRNLATNAGYLDVTRLVLAMETKLVENNRTVFDDYTIDDVTVRLSVDDFGTAELICVKNGKTLKNVPAALKKNEYILELKEMQKKLKEQYRRTVDMFEQAMENREEYSLKELVALKKNPVIAPIVNSLVYISDENKVLGLLSDNGLVNYKKEEAALPEETKLRVAHPFDMYAAGCWADYQSLMFEEINAGRMTKQPFRQVFRELYVKLSEEKDEYYTRMFAGNQIQQQKTVGCLKKRLWIADYEEGLQKIYYKDNIIAKMYALADWFSPSDIEAPTLEWVQFSDRHTFKPIKIEEVPDIVYSEIMRDVDLAVSVAHAGGVDPETSHSTIEMRRVIISHNLPLFKLDNVTLENTHAIIEGKLGRYSVHLGCGIIHKMGAHQINVLPVHSESRGRIFLPFVDEDPKTAEIMSKIVMFAEDEKIKDPYILEQIK